MSLALIRKKTQPLHHALESKQLFYCFSNSNKLTPKNYKLALCALYGILSPVEVFVGNSNHQQLLIEDIQSLDRNLTYIESCPYRFTDTLVSKQAANYMLQGSKLGAKIIYKMISSTDQQYPVSYFRHIKDSPNTRWQLICHDINAMSKFKINQLIVEIEKIYHVMLSWLDNQLVQHEKAK